MRPSPEKPEQNTMNRSNTHTASDTLNKNNNNKSTFPRTSCAERDDKVNKNNSNTHTHTQQYTPFPPSCPFYTPNT